VAAGTAGLGEADEPAELAAAVVLVGLVGLVGGALAVATAVATAVAFVVSFVVSFAVALAVALAVGSVAVFDKGSEAWRGRCEQECWSGLVLHQQVYRVLHGGRMVGEEVEVEVERVAHMECGMFDL
jgi:hypothetical protein